MHGLPFKAAHLLPIQKRTLVSWNFKGMEHSSMKSTDLMLDILHFLLSKLNIPQCLTGIHLHKGQRDSQKHRNKCKVMSHVSLIMRSVHVSALYYLNVSQRP